jgi:hypothetical protein
MFLMPYQAFKTKLCEGGQRGRGGPSNAKADEAEALWQDI